MKKRNAAYLGDGVYAETDGFHVILKTTDGISVTNEIFLDYEVLSNLEIYINSLKGKKNESDAKGD